MKKTILNSCRECAAPCNGYMVIQDDRGVNHDVCDDCYRLITGAFFVPGDGSKVHACPSGHELDEENKRSSSWKRCETCHETGQVRRWSWSVV